MTTTLATLPNGYILRQGMSLQAARDELALANNGVTYAVGMSASFRRQADVLVARGEIAYVKGQNRFDNESHEFAYALPHAVAVYRLKVVK